MTKCFKETYLRSWFSKKYLCIYIWRILPIFGFLFPCYCENIPGLSVLSWLIVSQLKWAETTQLSITDCQVGGIQQSTVPLYEDEKYTFYKNTVWKFKKYKEQAAPEPRLLSSSASLIVNGGESTHPPSSVRMRMNFERFCWLPKMTKSGNTWSSRGPTKAVVQGVMSTYCSLQFTICTARDVSPKADCNHCLRIGSESKRCPYMWTCKTCP